MQKLIRKWKQYRSLRSVTEHDTDIVISETDFTNFLHDFLTNLHKHSLDQSITLPLQEKYLRCMKVMKETTNFTIERRPSILPSGGQGVQVTSGTVPPACVTSLYPGLIYQPYEPIFFQSISNPFIFRCADGVLIDGNDKGLSKSLYKSCRGRDSCWPLAACDDLWLTPYPCCPLNIGQYVNNHNKEYPANVAYQEFNIPADFPAHLRQYLPNNHYSSSLQVPEGTQRLLRVVALVSLREVQCGEELFSSYFTLVR